MDIERANIILEDYSIKKNQYDQLTLKTSSLLRELIAEAGIKVHSIDQRTKTIESLTSKLNKPTCAYSILTDITDLSGIRIITYFSDDVDAIAAIIEREFTIDSKNSVDKRKATDPNVFGYASLHYVASLRNERVTLPEYRKFSGLKYELQIRSILQHAWAEIEHDMGYKTTLEVPMLVRRQFARLSGLMELADSEFESIRKALVHYRASFPQLIQDHTEDAHLDADSLLAYITEDSALRLLDETMAHSIGGVLETDKRFAVAMSKLHLTELQLLGISMLNQLRTVQEHNSDVVLRFFKAYNKNAGTGGAPRFGSGVYIHYLCYILAMEKGRNFATIFFNTFPNVAGDRKTEFLDTLFETYHRIKS